jgi:mono/diheme cytochrome c family protein
MRIKLFLVAVLGLSLVLVADDTKKSTKSGAKAAKAKTEKASGDATKGAAVYKTNCAVCHYADKSTKRIGPGLAGYFKKTKMENGKAINEANVREVIMEGEGRMPPFKEKLEDKQLDDLMAYLKSL